MVEQTPKHQISTWVPIEGIWEQTSESVTYIGGAISEGQSGMTTSRGASSGVALCGVRFASGTVNATITLPPDPSESCGHILLGYQSWTSRFIIVGLNGLGRNENAPAFVAFEQSPGLPLRNLEKAGSAANLKGGTPYKIMVGLDGQRLTLTVEGIKVLDHVLDEPLGAEQVGIHTIGTGPVKFESLEISAHALSAFVVMQFTEQFNELYDEVIYPVCENLGINAYRASDIYRPGVILQDILQGLDESFVVIAEITTRNANVFYELGYSHALRKPVILLAERGTQLPFDISGYRVIFYDNTIGGKSAVEADLRRHLTNILGE